MPLILDQNVQRQSRSTGVSFGYNVTTKDDISSDASDENAKVLNFNVTNKEEGKTYTYYFLTKGENPEWVNFDYTLTQADKDIAPTE